MILFVLGLAVIGVVAYLVYRKKAVTVGNAIEAGKAAVQNVSNDVSKEVNQSGTTNDTTPPSKDAS